MVKVQIILAALVLLCGQVVLWRRRDNLFAYLQAGLFFSSVVVPVLGTTIIDNSDPHIVGLYTRILTVGAFGYLGGLLYGGMLGGRQRLPSVRFATPFGLTVPNLLTRRIRVIGLAAVGMLVLSFLLLGYVPFFAADRVGAKYGVGIYRAGLERGALVFHGALRLGSTILPLLLVLLIRRRRPLDAMVAGAIALGLVLTLSRGNAFIGPLVFGLAVLIGRQWKAWWIVALVWTFYVSATLVNELVEVSRPLASASFSTRVAASAPDLSDHLGFLNGFEVSGAEHVGLRPIIAGFSLNKGEYNPSSYALQIRTGLVDTSEFASGGLRLPAPIWGYAAFGYVGAALWSFVSGIFIGWGTALLRRALTPAQGSPGQALNLVLAWIFFLGTFAIGGEFYFPERVDLISFVLALALCWTRSAPPDGEAPLGQVDHEGAAEAPATFARDR